MVLLGFIPKWVRLNDTVDFVCMVKCAHYRKLILIHLTLVSFNMEASILGVLTEMVLLYTSYSVYVGGTSKK